MTKPYYAVSIERIDLVKDTLQETGEEAYTINAFRGVFSELELLSVDFPRTLGLLIGRFGELRAGCEHAEKEAVMDYLDMQISNIGGVTNLQVMSDKDVDDMKKTSTN